MKTGCLWLGLFFFSSLQAATFGQVTVGGQTLKYEQQGKFAVVEGDIIIEKVAHLNRPGAVIIPKVGGTRWRHGVVPYEIDESLPFQNRLAILQAIEHWQQFTNIEFVERNSKNRRNYRDYIAFIPAEGTTCSSYVGRKGGMQEINLAPRCTTMNTVHELGHALGLWHEQSRADRNRYVRIVWENIEEEHQDNFDQHLSDGQDFGAYDYASIMHYGSYAFSKNGLKTIIPLMEGVEIGQRECLSEKDIAAIQDMYPES